jgi:DNA-binding MarR family transcriptional regulator
MSNQSSPPELASAATAAAEYGAAAGAVDEAAARAFGVNRTDLRIIGTLQRDGAMTAGRISESCLLSPAATSTAIQRLVAAGHVTRDADPHDRRRAVVVITPSAERLLEAIYTPVARAGVRMLRAYQPDDLAVLADFLQRGVSLQHAEAARIEALAATLHR